MPLILINGTYRVIGSAPDGDSVRFYPDDPHAFSTSGLRVRTNSSGGAHLRLDGMEALELRYVPRGSSTAWHQPAELAEAASAALLAALGFQTIERGPDGMVTASVPAAAPGHIVTRTADAYGRAVAFAFPSRRRAPAVDLARVHLDVTCLRDSANWMLLRQGLAFPTYYATLFPDLRAELTAAADHACARQRGVWPHDVTATGFRLTSREQLRDDVVVLPKLFRRLADYLELEDPDSVSLAGFPAYLTARADRLVTIPDGHATELDTLVEVRRQGVQLTVPSERVIFLG